MKAPKDNIALVTTLKPVWDAYGHSIDFDQLDDYKIRAYDHCYIVVRWKDPDTGAVEMADLYRHSVNDDWEFQNDGCEATDEDGWKKLYIPEGCDWFEFK